MSLDYLKPFALSLSKSYSWFDNLTTNGLIGMSKND